MPKKAPKVHPRSWTGQMARRWQTKYGELCQVLHEIRKNKEIADDPEMPPSFREPAGEEVQRLYPELGKLALEAGPKAFVQCWEKSGDIMGMIKGRSFQARVTEEVESAWIDISPLKAEFKKDGTAIIYPREPQDFNKAGLRRRTLAALQKDPYLKRLLDEPHGEELFTQAYRRALKELRLDNLPKSKPGPCKQPPAKKKTRR